MGGVVKECGRGARRFGEYSVGGWASFSNKEGEGEG